jgi:diaminohydroxyphosphoribosylaminopyrimidine deaminase/5-amino-6-(5-phosphoribosylamino)uracil reductase
VPELEPQSALDRRLMALAIAVGRRNLGLTWPNPSVGAVLVDGGGGARRILAQAATASGGRPHAEPLAIAAAGAAARGATLYVSLEPCSHHGRTPPCADAIVAAGIARVVTAIEDPNPQVAGRGHAILRGAGIMVSSGIAAAAASRAHRGHISRILSGRPFVTVKLACTPDGTAGMAGERLLITGEGANARTHMLRAHADAILVGIATVLADDPRLDVRLPGLETRRPVRIVLDSRLRLPSGSRLVQGAASHPVWVVAAPDAAAADEARLSRAGVAVLRAERGPDGLLDLHAVLRQLGERGVTGVFCEGGPALADGLARADLIDELVLMTGAVAAPSRPAIPALGPSLSAALVSRFDPPRTEMVGPDRIDVLERTSPCSPAL